MFGLRRAVAERLPNTSEVSCQTPHGTCDLEIRNIPEKDDDGNVVSVLSVWRDITRLRHAEAALRGSERVFRTLAENAPDPIIRYDRDCRRTYVNREFGRVVGAPASALYRLSGDAPGVPVETAKCFRIELRRIMRRARARVDASRRDHHHQSGKGVLIRVRVPTSRVGSADVLGSCWG